MGLSSPHPRRTPPIESPRKLAAAADLIKIRPNPTSWGQAELLAAYTWPKYQGEPLVPLGDGRYPDDSNHTALTIGEFLSAYRHLPVAGMLYANDTAYTYMVEPSPPSWSLAAGDPR
ncbi:hypothetical protein ACODT5_01130 [Streptomyces sp. 5.8]|uniref:hypothetical protein n=1 Tax=Streptomyces sp. 5.8 TaxID=3406571 RepID=UPI003BB6E838